MTERLYQQDSYLKTFNATVTDLRDDGGFLDVLLDRTVFFPKGGGVLGDEGTLVTADGTTYRVSETLDADCEVLHRLESPSSAGLAVGTEVTGTLDWERRYTLMRYHTATHVLCGVMYGDHSVRVTGNQLTPEKGRVDFAFEAFDRALLEAGFEKANAIIGEDRPVTISFIPATEAEDRPELFKLESGFRHNLDMLRLVDIENFDVQADGGCHVAHLSEIGRLTLTKSENKGKSNRRVYFVLA